jgi:hypothetical protein
MQHFTGTRRACPIRVEHAKPLEGIDTSHGGKLALRAMERN